jgi:hypothetical protein
LGAIREWFMNRTEIRAERDGKVLTDDAKWVLEP